MKLLICGDREWNREAPIRKVLEQYDPKTTEVIHGDARGADRMAGRIADEMGFKVTDFPAKWTEFGRAAGFIRNRQMLKEGPDRVIAFHENIAESKGTKDMLKISEEVGVPTELHTVRSRHGSSNLPRATDN